MDASVMVADSVPVAVFDFAAWTDRHLQAVETALSLWVPSKPRRVWAMPCATPCWTAASAAPAPGNGGVRGNGVRGNGRWGNSGWGNTAPEQSSSTSPK